MFEFVGMKGEAKMSKAIHFSRQKRNDEILKAGTREHREENNFRVQNFPFNLLFSHK